MLRTLSKSLLSFVFPISCELCGELLPARNSGGVCGSCLKTISLIPAPHCSKCGRFSSEFTKNCAACRADRFHFDRVYAAVYYDGHAKKLLRALKFERRTLLVEPLLEILERFVRENTTFGVWDNILAVPMHHAERFERGFNQAELLAQGVSKIFGGPFLPGALISERARQTQSKLGKAQRKENVQNRFRAGHGADVSGKKLLLVDDILTTGETASQCAKVMKDAGAVSVDVLVVARGC